jgi:hypothetical protein
MSPREAGLGPLACLTQLSKPGGDSDEVVTSLHSHMQSLIGKGGPGRDDQDVKWLIGAVRAASDRLSGNAGSEKLVAAALSACGCLLDVYVDASLPAAAAAPVYALMRNLVSAGRFQAAAQHTRRLQAALQAVVADGAAPASLIDVYIGSTLNLVICTAELPPSPGTQQVRARACTVGSAVCICVLPQPGEHAEAACAAARRSWATSTLQWHVCCPGFKAPAARPSTPMCCSNTCTR